MNITLHSTFLPHNDPEAALAFYRDTLGFEVRNDVAYGDMRWITVGAVDQPGTSIVLAPWPGTPLFATKDLDGTFERLQASDADIVQEPMEQPYGVRDFAVRDPAGNLLRIQQLR
ncbi:VOC family protein [Halomonas binhaiensis]|uniref:VOC family protein n=1 Tax=Halomonas binhaiensis TaxID=2562282 RepID=A0A5C1NJR9_9GAMM|nr:VOC family protein [Halomonas binhaiensis]QEM82638.1 VOC family protein [Halomonas binhaiensis]